MPVNWNKPSLIIKKPLTSPMKSTKTVYSQCLLSQALQLILRDDDYVRAQTLLEQGYPLNAPRDQRMLVYSTAQVYLACYRQDFVQLKQTALQIYQFGTSFQNSLGALAILPATLFLRRNSQFERAAEWLGSYEQTSLHRMTKNLALVSPLSEQPDQRHRPSCLRCCLCAWLHS